MPSAPASRSLTALDPSSGASTVPPPRRKWLTRIGLPAAILLITLALVAYAARDVLLPARSVQVVRVVSKSIETSLVSSQASTPAGSVVVQAPGWVEPDPFPIFASALTSGTVNDVLVLEGQSLKKNDVVARMVPDDARLAAARAQAELDLRHADLTAAQTEWDNPVDRNRAVAVAEAMLLEGRAELAQIDAQIVEQRAKLAEAEVNYARLKNLSANAAIALEVDQARFRLDAQKAAVDSVRTLRGIADAKIKRYEAELTAAKENLRLRIAERKALDTAKASVADGEAALKEAELRLTRMEVLAPADGIVMTRLASPGSKLMTEGGEEMSAHVVHLYDPRKLQVRADVPLGDAAKVGVGQQAQIVVDVLPDRTFTGRITRVVHQADIGKNTLQVKVAIEDPTSDLKPEMLARVKFYARQQAETPGSEPVKQTVLRAFAPQKLLQNAKNDQADIWLIAPDGRTATKRTLRLGRATQDGWIEVVEGLNPGDALILDPPDNLREGERVVIASQ
ncbi:MAG: efflux RND transporter periplasmic adaptor subunit [Phycisphaeraceae bacterium]